MHSLLLSEASGHDHKFRVRRNIKFSSKVRPLCFSSDAIIDNTVRDDLNRTSRYANIGVEVSHCV